MNGWAAGRVSFAVSEFWFVVENFPLIKRAFVAQNPSSVAACACARIMNKSGICCFFSLLSCFGEMENQ